MDVGDSFSLGQASLVFGSGGAPEPSRKRSPICEVSQAPRCVRTYKQQARRPAVSSSETFTTEQGRREGLARLSALLRLLLLLLLLHG